MRWAELSFAGPAPFPPRGGHAACRVSHDTVFVCGGGVMTAWLPEDVDRPREEDVDSCYVLTRVDETAWRCEAACCRMPHACGGHTACVGVVGDDVGVVVFGGRAYDNTADAHAGRDDMSMFSFLDEDVGGLSTRVHQGAVARVGEVGSRLLFAVDDDDDVVEPATP